MLISQLLSYMLEDLSNSALFRTTKESDNSLEMQQLYL